MINKNLANQFATRSPDNIFRNVSPFLSTFQGASQVAANLLLMILVTYNCYYIATLL